ncbi:hypothetical protein [Streptomyces boncukensis]|uniref:Uncharacterized protein n=1 Tax=Streptomyces boncukensis TaxID=2711219 RepID=A0A6G4WRZ9_9ACTN|nr:hypothetical protein [Streptomyces boncukensis]NGO67878.1 hypothetical protein [Streptomyces boncukensis]
MAGTTAPQRARESRKPTGKPNPPIVLMTGPEKTGKSYEAALGSASDLIGMTYWIEIGGTEGTADYYGRIPGARYEIVPHDGSYQDILDAIRWVIQQPRNDDRPNMLVIDSMTCLWDMLSDEIALFARRRAVRKAQENRRRLPTADDPVVIDSDLWNRVKDRWGEVLWLLRRHAGPCLLIARQEIVTAFENDKPTRHTTRKVKAEKNLPAAVDAIVELHALGEAYLTGVRTLHMPIKPGETQRFMDFGVDALLRRLGLEEAAETRSASELRPDGDLGGEDRRTGQAEARTEAALTSEQAAEVVRRALMDPTDPQAALHALREEYGRRTLQAVPTRTRWGQMSADKLITKSLGHLQEKAAHTAGEPEERSSTMATGTAQASTSTAEPEPADDHAPPPPDPAVEQSAQERPEDSSEAEEPQDLPRPRATRAQRMTTQAMTVLLAEADIQARILGVPTEDHLAPAAGPHGNPAMAKLKALLAEHKDAVIARLDETGQTGIADAYRKARQPELKIVEMFRPLYDDLAMAG